MPTYYAEGTRIDVEPRLQRLGQYQVRVYVDRGHWDSRNWFETYVGVDQIRDVFRDAPRVGPLGSNGPRYAAKIALAEAIGGPVDRAGRNWATHSNAPVVLHVRPEAGSSFVRGRAAARTAVGGGGGAASRRAGKSRAGAKARGVRIVRLPLNDRGWTVGYFSRYYGVGAPLYAVTDADTGDDLGELYEREVPAGWPLQGRLVNGHVRAKNRAEVEALVRKLIPGARFV